MAIEPRTDARSSIAQWHRGFALLVDSKQSCQKATQEGSDVHNEV
jgi:hypothetical protein